MFVTQNKHRPLLCSGFIHLWVSCDGVEGLNLCLYNPSMHCMLGCGVLPFVHSLLLVSAARCSASSAASDMSRKKKHEEALEGGTYESKCEQRRLQKKSKAAMQTGRLTVRGAQSHVMVLCLPSE